MIQNLPILPVLIPLMTAPLVVLVGNPRVSWILAMLAAACAAASSFALVHQVLAFGPIRYELGGWPPPFGIEYLIDEANSLIMLTVSGISAACIAFSRLATEREIERPQQMVYYALFLLCLTGLLGISATADAFNVFVFLEISSLATYALVAGGRRRRALLAAFQYLVLGTLGGSFVLIGIGFLYHATGTLNMADLALRLPDSTMPRVVLTALIFLILGLGLKSALFPLHQWLPNVYAEAPSSVSAFLAAGATKVAIYALARLGFGVFGSAYFLSHGGGVLQLLAISAMLYGSVLAIQQQELRRILAFSSLAQIGYLIWGLGLGTTASVSASFIHIVNHAVIKGALFLAVGCISFRLGGTTLKDLHGLAQRMPLTFALLVTAGFGLMGVPLTAGFISKWHLLSAAVDASATMGLVAMLISSVLAFIYVGRILEAAYMHPVKEAKNVEAPAALLVPAWTLGAAVLTLGIYSQPLVNLCQLAAHRLLAGG